MRVLILIVGVFWVGNGCAGDTVEIRSTPPIFSSEPNLLGLGGISPSGTFKAIKVDEDGYVLTSPVQQMDSEGRIKPSPCYERMQKAIRLASHFLSYMKERKHYEPASYMMEQDIIEFQAIKKDCAP